MADTGCSFPVAGPKWHDDMAKDCDKTNLKRTWFDHQDTFGFGPTDPIISPGFWRYEVCVMGEFSLVDIAWIETDVICLIGPKQLGAWDITWSFKEGFMMNSKGWLPVQYLDSDHPLIDMLRFEDPIPFSPEMDLLIKMKKDVEKQIAQSRNATKIHMVDNVLGSRDIVPRQEPRVSYVANATDVETTDYDKGDDADISSAEEESESDWIQEPETEHSEEDES